MSLESLAKADDFRQVLSAELARRSTRNPRYSQKAFARDLGLRSNHLGEILAGKRGVSATLAAGVATRLGLGGTEAAYLCDLARAHYGRGTLEKAQARARIAGYRATIRYRELDAERFEVLSDWVPMAILELTKIERFVPTVTWVAAALRVPEAKAAEAVARLEKLGVLRRGPKRWEVVEAHLHVPGGPAAEAIRRSHERLLRRAVVALGEEEAERRDFSALMVAAPPSCLPAMRAKLRQFLQEMDREMSALPGEKALFCLGVQLFPLSHEVPDA